MAVVASVTIAIISEIKQETRLELLLHVHLHLLVHLHDVKPGSGRLTAHGRSQGCHLVDITDEYEEPIDDAMPETGDKYRSVAKHANVSIALYMDRQEDECEQWCNNYVHNERSPSQTVEQSSSRVSGCCYHGEVGDMLLAGLDISVDGMT